MRFRQFSKICAIWKFLAILANYERFLQFVQFKNILPFLQNRWFYLEILNFRKFLHWNFLKDFQKFVPFGNFKNFGRFFENRQFWDIKNFPDISGFLKNILNLYKHFILGDFVKIGDFWFRGQNSYSYGVAIKTNPQIQTSVIFQAP